MLTNFANIALLETIRAESGKYYLDHFVSFLVTGIDELDETKENLSLANS